MTDEQVQFKSKFSFGLLPIHVFVCFGAGYVGQHFMKFQDIALRLLGLFFLGFFIVLLIELLKLKIIKTTKESLILTYPLLFKTLSIPWDNFIKVDKKIATTKTNAIDMNYSIGRVITLYTMNNKYSMMSFYYRNFDKFLIQLNKRLDASIKDGMRKQFNIEQYKFIKGEKELKRLTNYYALGALVIVVLIWLLS